MLSLIHSVGEVHDWNFQAAAGDTIYGRYYLPPHFDPSKKYPLIVNYYGGTSPTERSLENRYPSHTYAALRYVVYIIQPSGATGFGPVSYTHLDVYKRQIIGWDEILEGGLAPNATVMSWRGVDGGIEAAKQHHNVIMTPNTYL